MKQFEVTGVLSEVDFMPGSEIIEVLQNVKTLLTTIKFSVPLDRELGLNANMLDDPLPIAKARLTAEIFEAIPKYEPRVKVRSVVYKSDSQEGKIYPVVKVVLR